MRTNREALWKTDKRYETAMELLLMALLFIIAIFVCYDERLIAVYLDDLGTWELAEGSTIWNFTINTVANKFRPVSNFCLYIFWLLCGKRPDILGLDLLILHGLITIFIYTLAKKVSGNYVLAAGLSLLYAISRFAYYQTTQFLGIMETCALFFSVALLYCGYSMLNKMDADKRKLWGCIFLLYVLAAFAHERYMFLFPVMIYLSLILDEPLRRKVWHVLLSVLLFFIIIGIRSAILGGRIWDGTGGTDILDTFSVRQAVLFAFSQVFYLLGWNVGPGYLNGISILDYNYKLITIAIVMDIAFITAFITGIYCAVKEKEKLGQFLKNTFLFIIFISMCIGSSSTTIRVELRWIYTSYAALILYIASLWPLMKNAGKKTKNIGKISVMVFVWTAFLLDFLARDGWGNMYYQIGKDAADSLYMETYKKYGDNLADKQILVITSANDDNLISDIRREISTYDPVMNHFENKIDLCNNPRNIVFDRNCEDLIGLTYEGNQFNNITDYFTIYERTTMTIYEGIEPDGWISEKAHFSLYTGPNGKVTLRFYTNSTPEENWNTRTGRIYVNGQVTTEFVMDSQLKDIDLLLPANEMVDIIIENDFIDQKIERNGRYLCYTIDVLENS